MPAVHRCSRPVASPPMGEQHRAIGPSCAAGRQPAPVVVNGGPLITADHGKPLAPAPRQASTLRVIIACSRPFVTHWQSALELGDTSRQRGDSIRPVTEPEISM